MKKMKENKFDMIRGQDSEINNLKKELEIKIKNKKFKRFKF